MLPFCGRSEGSTAKKWFEESARGNWDPREGQHPFRPNANGVGDRTNTLRRLFIGAGFLVFDVCRPKHEDFRYVFYVAIKFCSRPSFQNKVSGPLLYIFVETT